MKRLFIVLALLSICSCSIFSPNYTYNGIRGDDLRHLNSDHIFGAMASFAAHTLGHYAAASLLDVDMWQDGLTERIGPADDSERFIIGGAGFCAQLAVGYILKNTVKPSDFTRGYNMATLIEVGAYPITDNYIADGSDMELMGDGGNMLWGLTTIGAIGLNIEKTERK